MSAYIEPRSVRLAVPDDEILFRPLPSLIHLVRGMPTADCSYAEHSTHEMTFHKKYSPSTSETSSDKEFVDGNETGREGRSKKDIFQSGKDAGRLKYRFLVVRTNLNYNDSLYMNLIIVDVLIKTFLS